MGWRPISSGVSVLVLAVAAGIVVPRSVPPSEATASEAAATAGSLLVIPNAGQFDPAVRFQVRGAGSILWVTDTSVWLTALAPEPRVDRASSNRADRHGAAPRHGVNLELTFPGKAGVRPVPTDPLPARINYLMGSDPSRWRAGVPAYGGVTWPGLYPGTSVTLREVGGELAFLVHATREADATAPRLRVAGASGLVAGPDGLLAHTAIGDVPLPSVLREGRPLLGRVDGPEASFGLPAEAGGPTPSHIPQVGGGLEYGTFLGASDDDQAEDLARGPDGATYLTGYTYSPDFPTTPGAFDTTYNSTLNRGDVFVSKLDPTGTTLAYSTFLGGADTDSAHSLALAPDGAVVVAGRTSSLDFPTTPGAYDTTNDGGAGFIARLTPDGSDLVYSTFLGRGVSMGGLVLAPDQSAYLTGETNSPQFPTTPGAYDRIYNGSGDAFVTHLNATGSALVYSTFLGGSLSDWSYGVALGADGTAYVTGEAQSRDFPTTPGAFDETFNGGNDDVFVARVNPAGSDLLYSTYVGGNDSEDGQDIAVDGAGNAFVTGDTLSANYPTTPGAYDTTKDPAFWRDALVTELNPSGSALVYSTFLGGNDYDTGQDLLLDPDGTLSVIGETDSTTFPTTPGAFDRTLGGSGDAFVARFDPTGSTLLYGSYLGGTDHVIDYGSGIASVSPGVVGILGSTQSADFPVTADAYDPTYNGGWDAFLVILRVARTMHVDAIVPAWRPHGPGYQVGAAVRIVYGDGPAVQGASVTVRLRYPDGAQFVMTRPTGAKGIAAFVRETSQTGTYTFTVLDVAKPGIAYDPAQNAETSDSITIP